jgi:two-component system nitrate/nitrite response regulator NarL
MTQHLTIIEPRFLVREALASLMTTQGYQVAGSLGSIAEIAQVTDMTPAPALVLLGSLGADEASLAASSIRKRWRKAKIVHLYDSPSSADTIRLLASEIDGCIPLVASKEVLVDACHKIVTEDFRILMLRTERRLSTCNTAGHDADVRSPAAAPPKLDEIAEDRMVIRRTPSGLSRREEEILQGLTRGHSNKIIARKCGISEATIKVHMKSILRKTQVSNRTQAAIWALEKGYGAAA